MIVRDMEIKKFVLIDPFINREIANEVLNNNYLIDKSYNK